MKEETDAKRNQEEEDAISIRDSKSKERESASALVARQQERENKVKKKWEYLRQVNSQENKHYTKKRRTTNVDEHSTKLLIKKKLKERKLELEDPTGFNQIYTTSLVNHANIADDNPLYAV